VGGVRQTISTTELRLSQQRIAVEEENRKEVQAKREVAADSLQSIQLRILDLETDTDVSAELGPLQYLSGLLDKPMDQIINWFILIIIFVFDPLAVALVIAFNNAVKVDKGEKDKKKIVQKRELYGEEPDEEQSDLWDNTLQDGLEDEEWDESHGLDQVLNDMVEDIEVESGVVEPIEFDEADLDKDGIVTEEERREFYESGGWRNSYQGKPYYQHPWFDWSNTKRWVNDRNAINFWMKNKGGSQGQLEAIKKQKYPDDFTSKTY
jgi:hypothetical protein